MGHSVPSRAQHTPLEVEQLSLVPAHSSLGRGRSLLRPFMYDLNQIPYDYTVELTNRVKGLDLIDRVPEEIWKDVHDVVQEVVIKTIPKKMK